MSGGTFVSLASSAKQRDVAEYSGQSSERHCQGK